LAAQETDPPRYIQSFCQRDKPLALATIAVAIKAWQLGGFPWIAPGLALSFGFYGYVRKLTPVDAFDGLTVETTLLFPLSLVLVIAWAFSGSGTFPSPHIDKDVLRGRQLDFATTFLPDGLSKITELPFLQAAQVYIPSSSPPNATVSYQLSSRGGGGLRTLNVPNWEGTTNQVEIFWNDFDTLNF